MNIQKQWLSVEEIAIHLGVKRDTIYKWLQHNRIPAHKVGRLWKFDTQEIDSWVRSGGAADKANMPDTEH